MRLRPSAVILGAALLLLAWLVLAALPGRSLSFLRDPVRLREWLRQWGAWVPLGIVLAQAVQVLLAPIPGHVVGLASGYLLGVGWGTFYSVIGTAVGSLVAFALARAYGRPFVVRLVSPTTLARLDTGARRRGLGFFVFVFLLPFLPDDLACFAAGLTSIPIPSLMLAVLLGRPPGIFVSAWLGATAMELGREQWVVIIALSVLIAGLSLRYGERLQEGTMSLAEHLSNLRD